MRRWPPPVGLPEEGRARRAVCAPRLCGSSRCCASAMKKSTRFAFSKSGLHSARPRGGGALRDLHDLPDIAVRCRVRVFASFFGVRDLPRSLERELLEVRDADLLMFAILDQFVLQLRGLGQKE